MEHIRAVLRARLPIQLPITRDTNLFPKQPLRQLKRTRGSSSSQPENSLDALLFKAPALLRQGQTVTDVAEQIWQEAKASHGDALTADVVDESWFTDDLGTDTLPTVDRFVPVEHPQVTLMYLEATPKQNVNHSADYDKRRAPMPLQSLLELAPFIRTQGTSAIELAKQVHDAHVALETRRANGFATKENQNVVQVMVTWYFNVRDYDLCRGQDYERSRRPMVTSELLGHGFSFKQIDGLLRAARNLHPLLVCCKHPFQAFGAFLPAELVLKLFLAVADAPLSATDLSLLFRTVSADTQATLSLSIPNRWSTFRTPYKPGRRADIQLAFLNRLARRYALDLVEEFDQVLISCTSTSKSERSNIRDQLCWQLESRGLALHQSIPDMKRTIYGVGVRRKDAINAVTRMILRLLNADIDLILDALRETSTTLSTTGPITLIN